MFALFLLLLNNFFVDTLTLSMGRCNVIFVWHLDSLNIAMFFQLCFSMLFIHINCFLLAIVCSFIYLNR